MVVQECHTAFIYEEQSGQQMSGQYWGVDLGGTKIEAVITDEAMRPLVRKRIATEAHLGYEHILERIAFLLSVVANESGIRPGRCIGIGTPGRYDEASRKLYNSNTQCLNGKDILNDLEYLLKCQVIIENDANCFALAESLAGAGRHIMREGKGKSAFGMIIGTGVGGGVVCGNTIMRGAHGIAGEWGHNVLEPWGEPCYCGKRGCVETIISGPALERYYQTLSGRAKSLKAIDEDKDADTAAEATIRRLTRCFSRALSAVINVLDPHCCIVGGGVGNVDSLYGRETRELIESGMFGARLQVPILRPVLGDSAGVFGAALLVGPPLQIR